MGFRCILLSLFSFPQGNSSVSFLFFFLVGVGGRDTELFFLFVCFFDFFWLLLTLAILSLLGTLALGQRDILTTLASGFG